MGHVGCMGKMRNIYKILGGLDVSGSVQELVAGSCEHSNEPSGSMKSREYPDWLSDY